MKNASKSLAAALFFVAAISFVDCHSAAAPSHTEDMENIKCCPDCGYCSNYKLANFCENCGFKFVNGAFELLNSRFLFDILNTPEDEDFIVLASKYENHLQGMVANLDSTEDWTIAANILVRLDSLNEIKDKKRKQDGSYMVDDEPKAKAAKRYPN